MAEVLKGNFKPRVQVTAGEEEEDLSSQFEREALRRLGGSIAFVSKKKFLYPSGSEDESDTPDKE